MLMTFQISEVERKAITEIAERMERSKSDALRVIIRQSYAAIAESSQVAPVGTVSLINQSAAMKTSRPRRVVAHAARETRKV